MSLLHKTIGWLAPPDCVGCGQEGYALCAACRHAEILPYGEHCVFCGVAAPAGRTCPKCRASAPRHVWATTDYSNLPQQLVQSYKFAHLRAIAEPIARLMAETLDQFMSPAQLTRLNYQVVHIPTATSRRRQRGFDHAELLARQLAAEMNLRFCPALGRIGQNRQLGATRTIRMAQQNDKYIVRRPSYVAGRNILLVDDVVTTGGTLKAATKVLRRAGAGRIDAVVFAKRI